MTRVVLLADGGADAGLGHVSRMKGLAAALKERGVETESHLLESAEPPARLDADAIVLDSYRIGPAELNAAAPVVAFHDVGREPAGAALVVDGANFDHACLQQPYWDLPARELSDTVGLVVVAVGAAGDFGDYAGPVRRALPTATVIAVRGPYAQGEPPKGVEVVDAPDSLAKLLSTADIAMVGAGQTMLEAAAAGTPTIAVPVAENQRRQVARLAELGGAVLSEADAVADEVEALARDVERRRALSRIAQEVVDGQGARRVAALVEELA